MATGTRWIAAFLTPVLAAAAGPTGGVDEMPALWLLEKRRTGVWLQRVAAQRPGVAVAAAERVLPAAALHGLGDYAAHRSSASPEGAHLAVWWLNTRPSGALDELGKRPPVLTVIDRRQKRLMVFQREPDATHEEFDWVDGNTLHARLSTSLHPGCRLLRLKLAPQPARVDEVSVPAREPRPDGPELGRAAAVLSRFQLQPFPDPHHHRLDVSPPDWRRYLDGTTGAVLEPDRLIVTFARQDQNLVLAALSRKRATDDWKLTTVESRQVPWAVRRWRGYVVLGSYNGAGVPVVRFYRGERLREVAAVRADCIVEGWEPAR